MKTYRLNSTDLVSTPGIIRYAMAAFPFQPDWSVRLLSEGYGLDESVSRGICDGSIQICIENETVTFQVQ